MEDFCTDDLRAAIVLVALGWEIKGIRREGRFCIFSFDRDAEADAQKSHRNEPIPCRDLLDAQRMVRSRMRVV